MSQTIFTTIDPQNTSGSQLATILGSFKDALMSGLIGNTRPTALQAGGAWIDNSLEPSPNFTWQFKIYTGSTDIVVFKINLSTGSASIAGSDSTFNVTKISADAVAPLFQFIKQRVANNGQLLSGDVIGELQFVGRTDASGNPLVARIRSVGIDQMTASTTGASLVFETTATAESAMTEVMRIINRRVGINTATPQSTLHVKGGTGIRQERSSDDAAGATVALKKSRVTGTGQVKSGDIVGTVQWNSTDNVSNDMPVAAIENKAVEDHTTTALGTKLTFRTIGTGTVASVDHVTMQNGVEVITPLTLNAEIQNSNSVAGAASVTALNAQKAMTIVTGSTATTVRGIDSTAASKVLIVHNSSTAAIVFKSLDTAANAADRIKLPSDRDLTLQPDTTVAFFYNTASSQWKLRSGGGSGGSDIITTLGDLIVGGTGGYATRLPVGADGYRLVADSTAATGVAWKAGALTTKGDILTNDGTKDVRLAVGANDTMLTPDSTVAGGLKWKVQPNATLSTPTGTLPATNGGTGATTAAAGFNNLSPLSSKGDTVGYDGTNNVRVPGGSFGQVLTYDAAQTAGFKWSSPATGAGYSYATNGGFEGGVTGIKYATTALTGGLPSGTGPIVSTTNARIAISAETTAPIRGGTSLKIATTSGWNAGDGVQLLDTITLQPEDLAKVITLKLAYQVVSGASTFNFSGVIGSQTLFLAVYDMSGAWVPAPTGSFGINQSTGVGIVTAQFQSSSIVGQQYQVYLFASVATSGASTILVDDFTFGTQTGTAYGPAMADFRVTGTNVLTATTTAPTKGTTSNDTIGYTRIGDHALVKFEYRQTAAGSGGSGDYLFALPSGLSFDANKVTFFTGVIGPAAFLTQISLGSAVVSDGAAQMMSVIIPYDTNRFRIGGSFTLANGNGYGRGIVASNHFPLGNATQSYAGQFAAPIAGWSSNTQVSSDTDTRQVVWQGQVSADTATGANTAITFGTITKDTHAAFSTNQYVVPVTGDYDFSGVFTTSASCTIGIYVNGTLKAFLGTNGTGTNTRTTASAMIPNLPAGSILTFRSDASVTWRYFAADYINISRKSGPSQIAATESVNCTVALTATTSFAAGALIVCDAKQIDTHNQYAAGLWTCPATGTYRLSGKGQSTTAAAINIKIGGAAAGYLFSCPSDWNYGGSVSRKITAGQTVGFYAEAAINLRGSVANGFLTEFTIERTGN